MKAIATIIAAMSMTGLASGTAIAACEDQAAGTDANQTASIETDNQGIAKDGTRAPLETEDSASASAEPAGKDGETMPLATQDGGGDKNLAMSQQDVEAQQEGELTAAAEADDCVVE